MMALEIGLGSWVWSPREQKTSMSDAADAADGIVKNETAADDDDGDDDEVRAVSRGSLARRNPPGKGRLEGEGRERTF